MASEEGSITIIPPEIITEILYRLPAKSVGRFRSVSKGWLSLLTQPHFIKTHQNTLNQHHLIFLSNDHMLYSHPFQNNNHSQEAAAAAVLEPMMVPFESGHMDFTFHASCNGLVLMSARDLDNVHKLVVMNPTTTEYVELSEFGLDMLRECESMYGFGYDSATDDYKAVRISYFYYNYVTPRDYMYVYLYSLRRDTWTRVIDSPYDDRRYDYFYDGDRLPGVFTDGFIHWVARRHTDDLRAIVAFSLAHECFCEVPSPESCNNTDIMSKDDCRLCVLAGKLAIFSQMKGEVWMMNEYGVKESWTKIMIYGLDEIPMVKPMIFQDKDNILLASNNRILIYDIEERCFSRNTEISRNQKLAVKGAYVESLFSPIPSRTN